MVIPSFWDSTHDSTAYPEPEKFLPERWLPTEMGEQPLADKYPQNYMVWGSGPHKVSLSSVCAFGKDRRLIRSIRICPVYRCTIRFYAFGRCHR
jgi:hypothetical protein